jgi:hypothetical protein
MKKSVQLPILSGIILLLIATFSCDLVKNPSRVVDISGEYACMSVSGYFREINRILQAGETIPVELEKLNGLSLLAGYAIDPDNNDIVLIGKNQASRPAYHAEDLIVNLQNVFDSTAAPYCSLDPIPENILRLNECLSAKTGDFETTIKACREAIGGQKVVVGGVPRNSRHAQIMIYADYDMKKLSQGLIKDAGISSCIDLSVQDSARRNNNPDLGSSMSRFWFHIKESSMLSNYPNFVENNGFVLINECPVVVLTEKQISDANGNLSDNKHESAEAFAKGMSDQFSELAKKYEVFAELENMFRLQACLRALKTGESIKEAGIDLSSLSGFRIKPGSDELPETLPGLVNYKTFEKTTATNEGKLVQSHLYLVAGGVSQEMKVKASNLMNDLSLSQMKATVLQAKPKKESIFWTVTLK